ncbi:HAD domain-containing protein [Kitasatospora sp. NPDC048365]|uniref:HAD domain-containing protein n=1 Tax=Kitasatospora sp. NPDC048365 TaxID=3364050 RepID=UPI0037225D29
MRPLLLIDVDGPLNPFAAKRTRRPAGYTTYRMSPPTWVADMRYWMSANGMPHKQVKPLRVWLNPDHGRALRELPFDLVWATTWQHEANEFIGPVLGLPELPVIGWPEPRPEPDGGVFWKTPAITDWVAGRPFAWVDDQITAADGAWVERHHDGTALLLTIDPGTGLRDRDFALLADWAAEQGR